jgi:nucleoside phosphorylase
VSGLLCVVGLQREAAILRRALPDARILIGGGQSRRLAAELAAAVAVSGIVSFGLCGALDPGMEAGDLVYDTADPAWDKALRALDARPGKIVGQDAIAATTADKAMLRAATDADAVDMESHLAREAADAAGVPFAALRAVSDAAGRSLPRAAAAGFRADGGVDVGAVVLALAMRPWDLPALIRLGNDSAKAFAALERAATALSIPSNSAHPGESRGPDKQR